MSKLIWMICGLLVVSWIVGVLFKLAEGVIHVLLVVAAFLGLVNLARGRQGPAT